MDDTSFDPFAVDLLLSKNSFSAFRNKGNIPVAHPSVKQISAIGLKIANAFTIAPLLTVLSNLLCTIFNPYKGGQTGFSSSYNII